MASKGRKPKPPKLTVTPKPLWELPVISITAGSFRGIRQYTINAQGLELNVTGLATGLSYNASLERIEADSEATDASSVATFTIVVPGGTDVVATTTVAVVEASEGWPDQAPAVPTPALRNRAGFAMNNRHAFTGGNPTILKVTNLNASGAGSFAAAWSATGNRIIVFETSGTINLAGGRPLIGAGNVWVAGQTAPNPGVTLLNGCLRSQGDYSNILVQHMRVHLTEGFGAAGGSGSAADAVQCSTKNTIFDHCEFMFSYDEISEVWTTLYAPTVDYMECIFAFALADTTLRPDQPPGNLRHDFGPILHSAKAGSFVSMQGCILSHHTARAPLSSISNLLFANNLLYNIRNRFSTLRKYTAGISTLNNFIGNRYKQGPEGFPDSIELVSGTRQFGQGANATTYDGASKLYVADNSRNGTVGSNQWTQNVDNNTNFSEAQLRANSPISAALPSGFVPWANDAEMEAYILARCGARPNNRNQMAAHLITSYVNGTGSIPLLSTSGSIPGADTSLAVNTAEVQSRFESDGYLWAERFNVHATQSPRVNFEVWLLDLADTV